MPFEFKSRLITCLHPDSIPNLFLNNFIFTEREGDHINPQNRNQKVPKFWTRRILVLSCLLVLIALTAAPPRASFSLASSVTLTGSLQSELGCTGDWQPDCVATHLTYVGNDVWRGEFSVPAGSWEYKMALDDSWGESYPAGNKSLELGAETSVRFYFDEKTSAVHDNINESIAVAAGGFQSELGCPDDWQPWCLNSLLTDTDGDGVYSFVSTDIPAGSYEFKIAMDEGWTTSYPGDNVAFSVPADGDQVTITWDSATTDVNVDVTTAGPGYSVALVGDLQDELGCPGDWQPECAATELGFDAEDDVWQGIFSMPAGDWNYKVALDDSWDVSYGANATLGGANISSPWVIQTMSSFITIIKAIGLQIMLTPSSPPQQGVSNLHWAARGTGSPGACAPGCRTLTVMGHMCLRPQTFHLETMRVRSRSMKTGLRTTVKAASLVEIITFSPSQKTTPW